MSQVNNIGVNSVDNNTIDLNDSDYSAKVLSYYIWGQKKPPKPDELSNIKWLNRSEVVIGVDGKDFANKYGHLFNLKDLKLMHTFFSGKTANGTKLDVSNLNTSIKTVGNEYILTHNEFVELFYGEFKHSDQVPNLYEVALNPKNFSASHSFYNRGMHENDYAKRAFVFGTTEVGLDIDSVRYILDKNLNPLRVENANSTLNF